jgi:hypothetical protein
VGDGDRSTVVGGAHGAPTNGHRAVTGPLASSSQPARGTDQIGHPRASHRRFCVGSQRQSGRRQIAVLACVLRHVNRTVSVEELLDAVRGEHAATERSLSRSSRWQLRGSARPSNRSAREPPQEPVIRTVSGGNLLEAEPPDLDGIRSARHGRAPGLAGRIYLPYIWHTGCSGDRLAGRQVRESRPPWKAKRRRAIL